LGLCNREGDEAETLPGEGEGMKYRDFLEGKMAIIQDSGLEVSEDDLNPMLFPWQKAVTRWALKRGRSALFEGCGLGKTPQQLEWARVIHEKTGKDILILAPLAVAPQTQREGQKFGIKVHICRSQADVNPGINVTNYEMIDHFDPSQFIGVVLDESSILKNFSGKTKQKLIQIFKDTPYKLCCTATPAPNDHMELGCHSEFLGIMTFAQMLAKFFLNDTSSTGSAWRLKGHAVKPFWEWVSSWGVCLSMPSDIGYSNEGFVLPPLRIHETVVSVDESDFENGRLFRPTQLSAIEMHREMRLTAAARAEVVAEMVNSSPEPWIVWCNTNYEADELNKRIPQSIEVRGSDSVEKKEKAIIDFISGKTRILTSKASMFGYGLNLQCCANMAFVGLSYSFEQTYQATRRCWRFGQTKPVQAHYIMASTEVGVFRAVQVKAKKHEEMERQMMGEIKQVQLSSWGSHVETKIERKEFAGKSWKIVNNDTIQEIPNIPDNSIHFSIFSPPFINIFVYSNHLNDMGNCNSDAEFYGHFNYLVPQLLRITKPGRLCAVHCSVLPVHKWKEGVIGLKDFRGEIIRSFVKHGWIFHSEVCIWRDPVVEMQRTKALGLLHKQIKKDSAQCRQGLPDYLVIFRKWPDNPDEVERVTHTAEEFPVDLWQRYASPVWMDIDQTEVLNAKIARADKDERHLCPLQLGVIRRALELWTNPGDLVYSPFAGIGSEGYESVRMGRRFLGSELKPEYAAVSARYLEEAEKSCKTLFTGEELAR
jgi:hypothetical protein